MKNFVVEALKALSAKKESVAEEQSAIIMQLCAIRSVSSGTQPRAIA
jgi:hypothetical protein